jgi:hypothetical protein
VRVVSLTPRSLYPREKSPRYPMDRRLGGPQSQYERHGEEKIHDRTGTRTPTPRSFSPWPVAIPTALSRLPDAVHTSTFSYTIDMITLPWEGKRLFFGGLLVVAECRMTVTSVRPVKPVLIHWTSVFGTPSVRTVIFLEIPPVQSYVGRWSP